MDEIVFSGFGLNIHAESTAGVVLTSDAVSLPPPAPRCVPEDLGELAAKRLFEEVYRGGCMDSSFQCLVCVYMTLTQKNVSQFIIGPLSPYT